MSKIKMLSIALISLVVLNLAITAFFLFTKPPALDTPDFYKNGPRKIIIERLGFTDSQIIQYGKLINTHMAVIKEIDDSIKIVKNTLYQTLTDKSFSGKDYLINQLSYLQNKIEHIHYNHFADIKALCTPKQLDKYNELTKDLSLFFSPEKKISSPKD
jgi:periplasmic protein CpxP/Spy